MNKKKSWISSVLSFAKDCKGKLILSIICALIGVAGGIVTFVSAYHIIIKFFDNSITKEFAIKWSVICILGFTIKVIFNAISTCLSHISAYNILENIRKRIADKFMKAPLGVVQGKSAGMVKNMVVDQVETIEIPLAHVIPEGIEVVKAFNQSTSSYAKYRKAVENFKTTTLNWYKSTWKYTTLGAVILPATLLGVLPIGTIMYMTGSAQLSEITMAMLLSMGMVGSLSKFIQFTNAIKSIQYSIDSLNETIDIEELPEVTQRKELKNYEIQLKNVEFSYTGKGDEKVINDISLNIPEKSFTALVGPSGGGKSTLARLISRFWDTTSGDIYIGVII